MKLKKLLKLLKKAEKVANGRDVEVEVWINRNNTKWYDIVDVTQFEVVPDIVILIEEENL